MTDRVGIIGMGRMGAAMAGTLRRSGFEVVVHNRTRGKADAVAEATGAHVATTAAAVAADTSVIISILADDAAVQSSYRGPEGLIAGLSDGAVVLEMSTIDPATVAALRPEVEAAGADLVDSPVSGSVALVEQGKLTIMAGGSGAAVERAHPVLEALAATVFHVGRSGAGSTMKLAVNGLVHAINVALSEALVLAEKAGVERAQAYEVFAAGAGGAPFVHYKQQAFLEPENTPVAFDIDLVAKDMELILGLADRVGAPMTQGAAGLALVRSAIEAGYGPQDMSAIAAFLRS